MSSVVETRKAAPSGTAPITKDRSKAATGTKDSKEIVPEDANLPDNYVAWALKNQKELPPITMSNVLQNINWVSSGAVTVTPAIAIWGLFNVKLTWATLVWGVIYYFITGLGMSCLLLFSSFGSTSLSFPRYHRRLPPFVGAQILQRVETPPVFLRHCRCRCCSGLH